MSIFQRPLVALCLFMFAMGLIPFNDALMDWMSDDIQVFEYMAIRGAMMLAMALAIPATLVGLRGLGWRGLAQVFARGSLMAFAMVFFFAAIAVLPLASVYALFFTSPLIISLVAIPLLGERLSAIRIAAACLGLAGTLVITRPWSDSFSPWHILVLLSAFAYAGYQLVTRMLPQNVKVGSAVVGLQLAFVVWGLLFAGGIILFGVQNQSGQGLDFLTRAWDGITWQQAGMMTVCAAITLGLAYAATNLYRVCEASFIAPFEYTALPMSAFWGFIMLGEVPTLYGWAGLLTILAAGLLMTREKSIEAPSAAT